MTENLKVIFIGIAGASGSGKSTYATHLADLLHSPLNPIVLDHFFTHYLLIDHPILGKIKSWEQSDCLDIEGFHTLLKQIKKNPTITTLYHREDTQIQMNDSIVIIIEGYLLFALSDQITNLFDIKIFLDSTISECRLRRYRRRSKIRDEISDENVLVSKEFQEWFDHLVWVEYLKHRDLQKDKADKIFSSNDYQQKRYDRLDEYILQRLINLRCRKKIPN